MSIFSRFADIINSNLNALLDRAEDPEKMIRMIIQEMEDTLVEVRSTTARTIAERKDLARQIEKIEAQASDWQAKAELAVSKQRDDLAKGALAEHNRLLQAAEDFSQQLSEVDQSLAQLNQEVNQLQEKLLDAKARQQSLSMKQKATQSRLKVKKQLHHNAGSSAVEKFARFERQIDGLEAQVESYDSGKSKSLADEIGELEGEDNLNEQLEQLKKSLASRKNKQSGQK